MAILSKADLIHRQFQELHFATGSETRLVSLLWVGSPAVSLGVKLARINVDGLWLKRLAAHLDVDFLDLRRKKIANVACNRFLLQQSGQGLRIKRVLKA
jgi:hypothetical protein